MLTVRSELENLRKLYGMYMERGQFGMASMIYADIRELEDKYIESLSDE